MDREYRGFTIVGSRREGYSIRKFGSDGVSAPLGWESYKTKKAIKKKIDKHLK